MYFYPTITTIYKQDMNVTEFILHLTNQLAGSNHIERWGLRKPAEKLAYYVTFNGFALLTKYQKTWSKNAPSQASLAGQPSLKTTQTLFDLTLSDEQQLIQESAARLASLLRENAQEAALLRHPPDQLWQEMHKLDLNTFLLPESEGGMGMSHASETWMLLIQAMAKGDMGLTLALLSPISSMLCITLWGNKTLQKEWLTKLTVYGQTKGTLALSEPHSQHNLRKLACTARKKRNSFYINGIKTMVPLSRSADFFLVSATLGSQVGLFLIPREAKGLTITNCDTMGLHAADLGTLKLNNVNIPQDYLLNDNNFHIDNLLARGQIAASALACGTSQAMLDFVIPYCNERKAFGEPVSHRQAVAFMIADIATELEGMKLLNYRATSRAERGLPFIREAYLAHHQSSTKGMQIGTDGVQLLGGHGFVQEYPVERWYRDLRAIPLLAGTLIV